MGKEEMIEEDSSRSTKYPKSRYQMREVNEEVRSDPGCHDQLKSIVDCMVRIGNKNASLWGIGCGHYVLAPAHLVRKYSKDTLMEKGDQVIPLELVKVNHDIELALFSFDRKFPPFKKTLLKVTPNKEQLINAVRGTAEGYQYVPSDQSKYGLNIELETSSLLKVAGGPHRHFDMVLKVRSVRGKPSPTVDGDCGAPLVVSNKSVPRKLIGFHFSSSKEESFNALICREYLVDIGLITGIEDLEPCAFKVYEEVEEQFGAKIDVNGDIFYDALGVVDYFGNPSYEESVNMKYVGSCKNLYLPATETNYKKHLLYGAFEETKRPAALDEVEVEDVSELDINRFGKVDLLYTQVKKFSEELEVSPLLDTFLEETEEELYTYLTENFRGVDLTPLKEAEALSGPVYNAESKCIDLRTSAGIPWCLWEGHHIRKRNYFNESFDENGRSLYTIASNFHGDRLRSHLHLRLLAAMQMKRIIAPWKNCLKDEPRPLEKVKKGKTRMFVAIPLDSLVLFRTFYEPFKSAWQAKRIKLPHAIGINPVSGEWYELYSKLLSGGTNVCDADFKNFDTRQLTSVLKRIGVVVNKLIVENTKDVPDLFGVPGNVVKDFLAEILEVLWDELVRTFHISKNECYLLLRGNPSGNVLTTIINCLVNLIYHWYAFWRIFGLISLYIFLGHVKFFCFGDDVIFSTDCDQFNGENIARVFKEIGQIYTPGNKSEKFEWKNMDNVTFLKRSFKNQSGLVFSPLERDSIEQQFNWTMINETDIQVIQAQINEACVEAAIHGRSYFKTFSSILKERIMSIPYSQLVKYYHFSDYETILLSRMSELVKPLL